MKKRLLCTTILLSLVLMSGCGKDAPEQAKAAGTTEIAEPAVATEAAPDQDFADQVAAEAPWANEASTMDPMDPNNVDASVLTDVCEYPSRSKVTYDTLFSIINHDELRDFALSYLRDNDYSYERYTLDAYDISYMGCLFQSYGVPGTENYTNGLAFFFREKYTMSGEEKCQIRAVVTNNLTLKEEGKFEDFQFSFDVIEASFSSGYPVDDAQFAAMITDPAQMAGDYQRFEHDIVTDGADMNSYFYDCNDEFFAAYADGSLVREVKYDSASDSYNGFFDGVASYFDNAMDSGINLYYPELSGKNTGTFSQG